MPKVHSYQSKNKKKAAKEKAKAKAMSSDEDSSANSNPDGDDVYSEEDEAAEGKGTDKNPFAGKVDGMADMMAKILSQKTSRAIPVLEKRKTAIMKQMDEERDERSQLKLAQKATLRLKTKQLSQPGHSNPEHEKALRKLATKGVVALFNAVAEAQRMQHQLDTSGESKADKQVKQSQLSKVDIKQMSKSNFLDLLTGTTTANTASASAITTGADASADADDNSDVGEAAEGGEDEQLAGSSDSDEDNGGGGGGAKGPSRWNALSDNYYQEDAGVLKNWKQDGNASKKAPRGGKGNGDESDDSDSAANRGKGKGKGKNAAGADRNGGNDSDGNGDDDNGDGQYLDDAKIRSSLQKPKANKGDSTSTGKRSAAASGGASKKQKQARR